MPSLPFDYNLILHALQNRAVDFLLVGGLNFYLLHKRLTTNDVDVLIDDSEENRNTCELALRDLDAHWGLRDEDWGPVENKQRGWLSSQGMYCLITKHGPLDVFRSLDGIVSYAEAKSRAVVAKYDGQQQVMALHPSDLLQCQLALPEEIRRHERVAFLRNVLVKHD